MNTAVYEFKSIELQHISITNNSKTIYRQTLENHAACSYLIIIIQNDAIMAPVPSRAWAITHPTLTAPGKMDQNDLQE